MFDLERFSVKYLAIAKAIYRFKNHVTVVLCRFEP